MPSIVLTSTLSPRLATLWANSHQFTAPPVGQRKFAVEVDRAARVKPE
jgi:hypothetical protein